MRIVVAPDKFKGSLTSFEVCDAISAGIKKESASSITMPFPMADGGDGFAAVLKYYYHTETVHCDTLDPLGRPITASYEWSKKDKTAIIEMAVASGLVLLKHAERNALKTSSYGTGLLIKHALQNGAKKIMLGLGGSATNDGGIGILAALGFTIKDARGNILSPDGENLLRVETITPPAALPEIAIDIACDVENTLYGPSGAAFVYAPQKGAGEKAVKLLDDGLKNLADKIKTQTGKDVAGIPGTGAAGGIAAGLMAFLEVSLKKGIDMVVDASGIEKELKTADLLITGEGKIDRQTLDGKVVGKLAGLAKENNIPVIAFCGIVEDKDLILKKLGIAHIESLTSATISRETAIMQAKDILTAKAGEVLKTGVAGFVS